ncbi:unnamed protein product [Adineta ricciae]|uniref:Uncharacterized protein n=1 Tax=Adineta ricciae TaxID=249248 RepID=A0A814J3N5_ADIRI|nr:unnamed protein product [Adineta ricciae]
MSFLKGVFSFKRAKPRKDVSKNPLKFSAEESYCEFGPLSSRIDMRFVDQKFLFNIENGRWDTANTEILAQDVSIETADNIRKQIQMLQEENNLLQVKIQALFNLISESIVEWVSSHR